MGLLCGKNGLFNFAAVITHVFTDNKLIIGKEAGGDSGFA